MSYKVVRAGSLKVGSYVIIDGEPCEIVEISKSKPGKHGSAKLRAVAIGVFDGVKRTLLCPVDTQVNVPVIEKRSGQVLSVSGESVQLMDLMTYEVFEAPMPSIMSWVTFAPVVTTACTRSMSIRSETTCRRPPGTRGPAIDRKTV